jgi:hypothetical protein
MHAELIENGMRKWRWTDFSVVERTSLISFTVVVKKDPKLKAAVIDHLSEPLTYCSPSW